MKNRIREMALLSVILAFAGLPALAQDATVAVSMPAAAAADPAPKPPSWGVPEGRMFFPHNWLRGYVNFDVAPSHNEPDLGRCSQSHAVIVMAGGASSDCNAYARYLLGGYMEVQPFGKTFARHVFVFFTPTFSFGNNVPQFKYTASMAGIAFERAVGIGIELPKNFEFRVTQHQVDWLGKYKNNVGLADLGTSGPY
ncbi:MAG TPA: hypothetical protein VN976_17255, partial [Verrucomicrobiae bacterium]|nr:hypothetical protein [Verrucomicrobiae bacterium]